MFSAMMRDMEKYKKGARRRPPISYRADIAALPEHIVGSYIPMDMDNETRTWLEAAADVSALGILLVGLLRHFVSLTTANGIVGRGGMFVMSTIQAAQLLLGVSRAAAEVRLKQEAAPMFGRLLDIGAGDGGVTSRLQPLFQHVTVTECSMPMRWRLWRRGYEVLSYQDPFTMEDGSRRYYDVISCLNVLDRTDAPLDLLTSMRDSLVSEGLLLLAVVLPWCPFVEHGTEKRPPSQLLPMEGGECCKGASFEQSLERLVHNVLNPCGFQLQRWCKLPYFSEGNLKVEYAVLYDAVMVLKKK
uniref:WGS project CAEQ00000000 data, annotated contig 2221 n=1 Tax=Trypanosoma congolense (strain IL3000) TaxID=1068625 RepID=F9WCF0_TRYCI|nr:unnamed protein product [Trypanosoma congolense IL3000]